MDFNIGIDMDVVIGDKCPKCRVGILKNFPILGTDFLICSENCGYKIYSLEKLENIKERFDLFIGNSWVPPVEK